MLLFFIADFILSFDSLTLVSGSPTISNVGSPPQSMWWSPAGLPLSQKLFPPFFEGSCASSKTAQSSVRPRRKFRYSTGRAGKQWPLPAVHRAKRSAPPTERKIVPPPQPAFEMPAKRQKAVCHSCYFTMYPMPFLVWMNSRSPIRSSFFRNLVMFTYNAFSST